MKTANASTAGGRIVLGVDEAGYGPNIGPLLVAATAWRCPQDWTERDFAEHLKQDFSPQPWSQQCQHIPLGDSKQLYSPASGLRSLEAGLLAMFGRLPKLEADTATQANSLKGFLERVLGTTLATAAATTEVPEPAGTDWRACPWYEQLPETFPEAIDLSEVERLSRLAGERLERFGVQLLAMRAIVVAETNFNQLVARLGSKGRLLSTVTMELVSQLLPLFPEEPVEVFCDRQGGRKRYSCVLAEAFPDDWFDILAETPERSSYRRQRAPNLQVHFSVGGDSFPPTALASMTAKYLRERLMGAVNRFWTERVTDLKPTAGYPVDAKRFREQMEPTARKLGLSPDQWWRVC